jgi:hypothetical protein
MRECKQVLPVYFFVACIVNPCCVFIRFRARPLSCWNRCRPPSPFAKCGMTCDWARAPAPHRRCGSVICGERSRFRKGEARAAQVDLPYLARKAPCLVGWRPIRAGSAGSRKRVSAPGHQALPSSRRHCRSREVLDSRRRVVRFRAHKHAAPCALRFVQRKICSPQTSRRIARYRNRCSTAFRRAREMDPTAQAVSSVSEISRRSCASSARRLASVDSSSEAAEMTTDAARSRAATAFSAASNRSPSGFNVIRQAGTAPHHGNDSSSHRLHG